MEPFQNPLLGCRSGVVANGTMSGGRFRTVVSLHFDRGVLRGPPVEAQVGGGANTPPHSTIRWQLLTGSVIGSSTIPSADRLRQSRRAVLKAPLRTTTTVILSPVATGLAPTRRGAIGYTHCLPSVGRATNMLQWPSPRGLDRLTCLFGSASRWRHLPRNPSSLAGGLMRWGDLVLECSGYPEGLSYLSIATSVDSRKEHIL
jgi:hypothetical protein